MSDSNNVRRYLKRAGLVALPGIAGLGLLAGVALGPVSAAAPPSRAEQVRQLVGQDGHEYPAIVANVNHQPITGKELAQRVYTVQQSQAPGLDKTNPARTALNQLIEERVLVQAAEARGITVSDADVVAFAQSQQNLLAQAKNLPGQEIINTQATSLGIPPTQYASDSRVIKAYRQGIILGRMRAQIAGTLPAEQRDDPAAVQAAITGFVAQSGAQIERLLNP